MSVFYKEKGEKGSEKLEGKREELKCKKNERVE